MAGRVTLIILLIACVIAGCGGSTSSLSTISGEGNSGVELSGAPSISGAPAPSMNELQGILQAEFDRLGIDPEPVDDNDPPVWTEVYAGGMNNQYNGIRSVRAGNGVYSEPSTLATQIE